MFGTLKPACLSEAPKATHSQFYCGLCAALGADYGLALRGLVSYDAVLLGLLVDSLELESATPSATRCPLLPLVHKATVAPESRAMRFASAAQILLADQWLADRGMDGGRLIRAARPLLAGPAEVARGRLRELGLDPAPLEGFELRQAAVEAAFAGPEAAAAPTAEALGLVFGWIGELGGLPDSAPIADLGRATGTLIYLIDAVEDVEGDQRAEAFNPLIYKGAVDAARITEASRAIRAGLADVAQILEELPLKRHREVIESVLIGRLGAAGRRALRSARHLVEPADMQRRSALVAALAWVLLFLFGLRPAWAEPTRKKKEQKRGTSKKPNKEEPKKEAPKKDTPKKETAKKEVPPADPAPQDKDEPAGSEGGDSACCSTDSCCDPCLNTCCGGCVNNCDGACNDCCNECNGECNRSVSSCCNCNNCCNEMCKGNSCCGGTQCSSASRSIGTIGEQLHAWLQGGGGRGLG